MIKPDNLNSRMSDKKDASSVNQDIVRKYIDLFNRLPIGIYRTTPDGKILTANPAFLALIGCNHLDDLEGIDLSKTHKNIEARLQFMREIEEQGEVFAKESILVCNDGKEIIVEEYAKVYKDDNDDVLFYEGIVIDITGKKRDHQRIAFLYSFKELILNLTSSFINIRLADIDDQIVFSLKSIGSFIGADRSYVFLFDDDMRTMSNTHESVTENTTSVINELQELTTSDFPWWMNNLKKNRPIIIPDVSELPELAKNEKEIFLRQNIQSLFAVPMFFDYRLIGFLGFDMVRDRKMVNNDTLELLNIAASLFANILNYQETEQKIIENSKHLERLVEERTLELESANKQLKLVAESSNDVIWTMDMNLHTTYMSPSVFKQLGFTAEEYLAMPVEERIPPESLKKVKETFSEELAMLKSGERKPGEHSVIFEMLHKNKSGELVWGEVSFNFLFDAKGNPIGIHGITRNVHERKLAEDDLWESNERFKSLVENTSDWIWEVNAKGIYTYVSPVCESLLGYKTEEVIGRSFSEFLDPENKKQVVKFFKNMALSKRSFKNQENIALHKNGRKVFLETSGIPIYNAKGGFIGYRGVDRDITEKKNIESALKHSQSRLSQHLRNTPMGYIEWDNKFEVIEWNPAAQKIFGYNKTQAMVENMVEKLVPFELRDEVLGLFPKIIQSGKPVRTVNRCLTREGKKILCEWFNTPLYNESENIIGMASLVREVSQPE
ncbi:MAG: PAS domain S-box protein [Bacteroidales bacterium]|nr:PAS domain S-box protein [Bacteroidales bacterium]